MTRTFVLLILALASPTWAATTRCTTYKENTLGRLHTASDDGTRAGESAVSGKGPIRGEV